MNIGLKFRDRMFGALGNTVREELDQVIASIVQHWLVGHRVDGSHSNKIGSGAPDVAGSAYLNDQMEWVADPFPSATSGATISGAWTFTTLPVLGTLNGYVKATAGALSAAAAVPAADVTLANDWIANANLANMAQDTIKLRATSGTGDPEDKKISDLTEQTTPGSGDLFLMESGGSLRKVDWSKLPGASAGEANTASNQGVGGVGLYDTKVGVDLQFRNINGASSKISVALDAPNKEVDIDVVEANLTLSNMGGTLGIASGGTGETTAQNARNALLPSQTGNAGKVLQTDGSNVTWEVGGGGGMAPLLNLMDWGGL